MLDFIKELKEDKELRNFMLKIFWLLAAGILTDNAFYTMKAKCYMEAYIDELSSNLKQATMITEIE